MKNDGYFKTVRNYNDTNNLKLSRKYPNFIYDYNANTIDALLKEEILKELSNNIEFDRDYAFRIEKNTTIHPIALETHVDYNIFFKKINTIDIIYYNYDDKWIDLFKKPNKLFTRIKLAFKYIFKKQIKEEEYD